MNIGVSLYPHGVAKPWPDRATWSTEKLYEKLTSYTLRADITGDVERDLRLVAAGDGMEHWWGPDRERLARAKPDSVPALVGSIHKRRLASWSPATFPPGAKRHAAGVLELSCLVLDIDGGSTFDQVWGLWPEHQRVMHTTWSHTPERQKLRLVLPLAEPVPAAEWKRIWAWAMLHAHRAGVNPDTCSNEDRVYFMPALQRPTSIRQVRVDTGGELLHLDWRKIPKPRSVRNNPHLPRTPINGHLTEPVDREAHARKIGAELRGEGANERVVRHPCPNCGMRSAWFYIHSRAWARCDHKNTCGWSGPLLQLGAA